MTFHNTFHQDEQEGFTLSEAQKTGIFKAFEIYGVVPFLEYSLGKIKNNVTHPGFRIMIEDYMENYFPQADTSGNVAEPSDFHTYARIAYKKVMVDQEYLHRILLSLESEFLE